LEPCCLSIPRPTADTPLKRESRRTSAVPSSTKPTSRSCGERKLAPIENWHGEDALVSRPYLEVEVRALPQGGAAFLLALAEGRPLSEAAETALADDPDFDLTGNLAGLIGSGLVRNIIVPEPESCEQP